MPNVGDKDGEDDCENNLQDEKKWFQQPSHFLALDLPANLLVP